MRRRLKGDKVDSAPDVDFKWKRLDPSEQDETCRLCGVGRVEFEIVDVRERTSFKRCERCFSTIKKLYNRARWKPPIYEDKPSSVCSFCGKPIPWDFRDVTFEWGKPVHVSCFLERKAGRASTNA